MAAKKKAAKAAKKATKPVKKAAKRSAAAPAAPAAAPAAAAPVVLTGLAALVAAASGIAYSGQTLEAFSRAALEPLSKISDEDFAKLPKGVPEWYDAAVDCVNSEGGKTPADLVLEGFPAPGAAPAVAAAAAPAKPTRKAPGAAAAKPEKKAKEKAEAKPRTDSVSYKIRLAVIKKPTITFEAVCEKVGVKPEVGGHAFNMFNHARIIMGMVTELDMLK